MMYKINYTNKHSNTMHEWSSDSLTDAYIYYNNLCKNKVVLTGVLTGEDDVIIALFTNAK